MSPSGFRSFIRDHLRPQALRQHPLFLSATGPEGSREERQTPGRNGLLPSSTADIRRQEAAAPKIRMSITEAGRLIYRLKQLVPATGAPSRCPVGGKFEAPRPGSLTTVQTFSGGPAKLKVLVRAERSVFEPRRATKAGVHQAWGRPVGGELETRP